MVRVGLYLMGLKGLNGLKAISNFCKSNSECQINFVVCSPDKNVINDYFEEIKVFSNENKTPFIERNGESNVSDVDLIFAIGWRWIINKEIDKLIVFHDSLLPKLRGFNPLVTALIEGYTEIGVTAIKANKEFDRGNILGLKKAQINYPLKIDKATEIVSKLYDDLLIELLQNKISNKLVEIVQHENEATYSLWRDEEDYQIDWTQTAEKISRTIDALGFPYKGASSFIDDKKIRIYEAIIINDYNIINRVPGKILFIEENNPIVVCGSGLLKIMNATYEDDNKKVLFNKLRLRLK